MDLLKILIQSSEKAANIARLLRQNDKLFQKLVEQKSSEEANPRFQEDFKTLADVLIQEMVKYDVGIKFPYLKNKIYGEENNHFYSSKLNKEMTIEIQETQEETSSLLSELFNDNEEIAKLLATEVHKVVELENIYTKYPVDDFSMDLNKLSIWIDPIDGTNEYVKGGYEEKIGNLYPKGLKCVTVLIGVYDDNSEPIIGIINQPFFDKDTDIGFQCNWGVSYMSENGSLINFSSVDYAEFERNRIIFVGGNETNVVSLLQEQGYNTAVSTGAGYKLLAVILGLVDAYVLSKPTTYFWDTCAPQAILKSIGGNIITMDSLKRKQKDFIRYHNITNETKCNKNGIVAYRDEQILSDLMEIDWTSIL
ncbi:inositol polyphosphate 1-phosphatase [Anthonomus grandis grandis]|uniref:inositol polyphosphate 1-phosphatase n=1 Tax=Anthonomus grandis grandis TaxID=2921223 RepID=UPI002165DEBB|nr:inositol polyphosphate 1-phosphatase [Anthonomus grandis grandis]XP_050309682.1 inositol polyphosphate 1-phosphatase [Anthonomus grandis grandis]